MDTKEMQELIIALIKTADDNKKDEFMKSQIMIALLFKHDLKIRNELENDNSIGAKWAEKMIKENLIAIEELRERRASKEKDKMHIEQEKKMKGRHANHLSTSTILEHIEALYFAEYCIRKANSRLSENSGDGQGNDREFSSTKSTSSESPQTPEICPMTGKEHTPIQQTDSEGNITCFCQTCLAKLPKYIKHPQRGKVGDTGEEDFCACEESQLLMNTNEYQISSCDKKPPLSPLQLAQACEQMAEDEKCCEAMRHYHLVAETGTAKDGFKAVARLLRERVEAKEQFEYAEQCTCNNKKHQHNPNQEECQDENCPCDSFTKAKIERERK